jgi:hypothetical protein
VNDELILSLIKQIARNTEMTGCRLALQRGHFCFCSFPATRQVSQIFPPVYMCDEHTETVLEHNKYSDGGRPSAEDLPQARIARRFRVLLTLEDV